MIAIRNGVAPLKIAEPAQVTLKRAQEMVPIPSLPVAREFDGGPPIKTIFIGWDVVIETVI